MAQPFACSVPIDFKPEEAALRATGLSQTDARHIIFEPLEPRVLLSVAADAHEPNDYSWLASPVTLSVDGTAAVTGLTIGNAGSDVDWFSVTTPAGATGPVSVSLSNVSGGLAGDVRLYRSVLGSLSDLYRGYYTNYYGPEAEAQASGENQSVALDDSDFASQAVWYVRVSGLGGTTGTYDLSVSTTMVAADALEPNNSAATATDLTASLVSDNGATTVTGLTIHRASDEDWFRIDAPANADGNLTARVDNLTGGLAGIVWVYRQFAWGMAPVAAGVFANWMPGGSGQAVVYNADPGATYFVRVDNFYSETGGYRLDVTLPLDAQAKDAYELAAGNNLSWLAAPLTPAGSTAAVDNLSIHNSTDQDWFSFTPTANGAAQITLSGVHGGLAAHVALYDTILGSLVTPKTSTDASAANGTVTLTFTGLKAWTTYYIQVSGNSATTGLYTLGLTTAPADNAANSLQSSALLVA